MKLLGFVIFFAVLYEINSAATRICGPNLAQLLGMVCEGGFNGMKISKKSINKPVHDELDVMSIFNDIDDDGTPFKSDSLLKDMLFSERLNTLAKTRRQRNLPGVYDECCVKGCTLDELAGYCL